MTITDTLAAAEFVLLTTFRRDGTPVPTPVWVVPLDGEPGTMELGVITAEESGKVRRIRRDGAVTLTPCDRRGAPLDPDAAPVRGTARVLDGPGTAAVRRAVRGKYGIQGTVISLAVRLTRRHRVGLAVRPAPAAG